MSHAYDGSMIISRPATLRAALEATAAGRPQEVAFLERAGEGWTSMTWADWATDNRRAAAGLLSLELAAGDLTAVAGDDSVRAEQAQVAAVTAGAAVLHLGPARDLTPTAEAGDAAVVFVGGPADLDVWRRTYPDARGHVVLLDGEDAGCLAWDDLLAAGDAWLVERPEELDRRAAKPSDVAFRSLAVHDGALLSLAHGPAALTYPGAALGALDVLRSDDVVLAGLVPGAPLARAMTAAHLVVGFTAVVGALAGAEQDTPRPSVVVFGQDPQGLPALGGDASLGWSLDQSSQALLESLTRRDIDRSDLRQILTEGPGDAALAECARHLATPVRTLLVSPFASGPCAVAELGSPLEGGALPYSELRVDDDGLWLKGPGLATAEGLPERKRFRSLGQPAPAVPEVEVIDHVQQVTETPTSDLLVEESPVAAAPAEEPGEVLLPPPLVAVQAGSVAQVPPPHPELWTDDLSDDEAAAIEARFVRLCAPSRRLFLAASGDALVALVAFDDEGLGKWASVVHVPGEDFAALVAAQETHGFVEACVQATNSAAGQGRQITDFALLDRPVATLAHDRREVLAEYEFLVDQLAGASRMSDARANA